MTARASNAGKVARGLALFAQNAAILDVHLAGKTWVALDRVTLAHYSLAAGFALAGPAPADRGLREPAGLAGARAGV